LDRSGALLSGRTSVCGDAGTGITADPTTAPAAISLAATTPSASTELYVSGESGHRLRVQCGGDQTQIWIAVCVYVLAAIIRIELALNVSLYTFLQILSVHSFEKVPLAQALFDGQPVSPFSAPSNQMNLSAN